MGKTTDEYNMKGEYKLSKGWWVASWIILPLVMLGGIWFFFKALSESEITNAKYILYLGIGSMVILIAVYGLLDLLKSKIIIGQDRITSKGVFKTKTLLFTEIEGLEINENYLFFIPFKNRRNLISFSKYYQGFYRVMEWAYENFTDLDQKVIDDELDEISTEDDFGRNEEERLENARLLKKKVKYLNGFTWIIAVSLLFYPKFYNVQITICAFLPLIAVIIYIYSKGLARTITEDNSPYPSLSTAVFVSSGILMIRALKDEEVMDYTNFWISFVILSGLLFYLFMYHAFKGFRKDKIGFFFYVFAMLLVSAAYSYSVILLYNDILDKSEPTVYKTVVMDKRISRGKHYTYYVTPAEWGDQSEAEETSVSRKMYEDIAIGDTVFVKLYSGKFKLPYYYISKE